MTQGELDAAIALHQDWFRSEGAEGELLALESEDLSSLVLDGACLIGASFTLCNLSGASFVGTCLADGIMNGCDLSYANMLGCTATGTDFTSCNTTLWTAPNSGGPA